MNEAIHVCEDFENTVWMRAVADRWNVRASRITRQRILRWALAFVLPAAVMLLYGNGVFQHLSLMGYDLLFALRGERPADERLVIVAQDNATMDHYQIRLSDWPRSWHARLIESLSKAGAELIVFDYDFSRPSQRQHDAEFARAIQSAGNVILTNHLRTDGRVSAPLPAFSAHTLGEGLINTALDADGHWRRMPYAAVDGEGYVRFSLPLTTVEIYENFPVEQRVLDRAEYLGWGSHHLPYPDMRINFRGPGGTFTTLSYHDLLEGDFDPARVRDRIVLIGNTHRLGKDFFATPLDPRMPGVEVHANAISSILNDEFIRAADTRFIHVLVLSAGLLAGIAFFLPRIGLVPSLLITALTVAATVVASYYMFAARHTWLDVIPIALAAATNFTAAGTYQWRSARQRAQHIRSVFGRYVSRNVVDVILARETPIDLKGHHAEVSVLFSDIRGFTSLSESLSPEAVGQFLNRYFEEMIQCVFDHDGTLDKLMGDAVMAFFGAPLPVSDHPLAACRCALDMSRRLEAIRAGGTVPDGIDLEIGVGINTGGVIAGNLGSSSFIDYTVIGDNVNLGSRLEGLNKRYGTRIIVSEATYAAVKDQLLCRELDSVRVKGKDTPTRIFEVLGEEVDDAALQSAVSAYEQALACYRRADWDCAIRHLEWALRQRAGDGPSRALLERCHSLKASPPPADWDGVTALQSK